MVSLAAKMAVTALLLVIATFAAERTRPVVGAMIATLPIQCGLSYAFLALDHTDGFIAAAVLVTLAGGAPTCAFVLVYIFLAQRYGLAVSVVPAMAAWIGLMVAVRAVDWTVTSAVLVNVVAFGCCLPLSHRFRHAPIPPVFRRWYDVPMRAAMVATLVATVIILSRQVGPALTGMVVAFPVALLSLMLILHPRMGGPAAAAVLTNCMLGMIGFGLFCLTLHLTVVPLGVAGGLCVALAVNLASNLGFWAMRRGPIKA